MSYEEKASYAQEATDSGFPQQETGHVRSMLTELDENANQLLKTIDMLAGQLRPVSKDFPESEASEKDGVPQPLRCMVADELARVNERLINARVWINKLSDRLDV